MALPLRSEVDVNYTWNLTDLCKNDEEAKEKCVALKEEIQAFNSKFEGNLNDVDTAVDAIDAYRSLLEQLVVVSTYSSLKLSSDQSDAEAQKLSSVVGTTSTLFSTETSFLTSDLLSKDEEFLTQIKENKEEYTGYIDYLLRFKPYQLDPKVEKALASISNVFSGPYELYLKTKLLDLDFGSFTVDGKGYPLSYLSFEGELESHLSLIHI